jgi:hypothetical protein
MIEENVGTGQERTVAFQGGKKLKGETDPEAREEVAEEEERRRSYKHPGDIRKAVDSSAIQNSILREAAKDTPETKRDSSSRLED